MKCSATDMTFKIEPGAGWTVSNIIKIAFFFLSHILLSAFVYAKHSANPAGSQALSSKKHSRSARSGCQLSKNKSRLCHWSIILRPLVMNNGREKSFQTSGTH